MCDTLTITPTASADTIALFAKNSDREPNEAHEIVLLPAADYAAACRVRCTYIEIDQAPHTYAVALAKPFWIWGAEMGVNEHGVAIGNEAVFTKEPCAKNGFLTGMDLLRLTKYPPPESPDTRPPPNAHPHPPRATRAGVNPALANSM